MTNMCRFLISMAMALFSLTAMAIPTLQLNIEGGVYQASDETIVTSSSQFTLDAFARVESFDLVIDQPVYLSVAITPKSGPDPVDFGSFKVDGNSYDMNSPDLMYGVPPVENAAAIFDGGDLGKHEIFETLFLEIEFYFNAASTVEAFNTQDEAGNVPVATSDGTGMYIKTFDIDTSGLLEGFELHFDLYNTKVKNNSSDLDIDDFAPFSHDAATVPEPHTITLLVLGMLMLGVVNIRSSRQVI